jgi:prepilin-type N-terminal cleavage/methylation domain-containing protein
MPRSRHVRSGFSLAEVVVALALAGAGAVLALGAWGRTQEAGSLHSAQSQIATILRDAVQRADRFAPAATGGVQVVFVPGTSTIMEQVQDATGAWQAVTPPGVSQVLPAGITVAGTTWPQNTMRVAVGETDTGVFQASRIAVSGAVTLVSRHGMTAQVTVTGAGTVGY